MAEPIERSDGTTTAGWEPSDGDEHRWQTPVARRSIRSWGREVEIP